MAVRTLKHATMTETATGDTTYNLSGRSTLDLTIRSGSHVGTNSATVNLTGTDNFTLHNWCSPVTINITGGMWNGTVQLGEWFGQGWGTTTVNGGPGATWNNNGVSLVSNAENLVVKAPVVGSGSFDLTNSGPTVFLAPIARMEFAGSVGANQTIRDSGLLVLDRPDQFSGHVVLSVKPGAMPDQGMPSQIDLAGLANADSYTFQNDMLRLYSGTTVIDRLRLTDATPNGFAVQKAAGSVNIVAILDPTQPPVGLPLHA